MIAVPLIGSTIPHEVEQKVQTAKVLLRPASEGTGVIAGSAVRAVMEAAGIRDVLSKSFGSDNVVNIVWATMACLRDLKSVDQVAQLRGKRAEDIPFRPRGRSQQNGH
jgi:small subunit ribosomal protein S5